MKFYQDWLNNDLAFSFIILAVSYAKVNWIRFATLISLKVWTKPKTKNEYKMGRGEPLGVFMFSAINSLVLPSCFCSLNNIYCIAVRLNKLISVK